MITTADGPLSWELGAVDLTRSIDAVHEAGDTLVFTGRALLAPGTATQLTTTIGEWLCEETARGAAGEVDSATEQRLSAVRVAVQHLDLLTGILDRLLGLPYDPATGGVVRVSGALPAPVDVPRLLLSGNLELKRARLLDTFGRVLDLDVSTVSVPVRSADPGNAAAVALPPRFTRPARWMFRLVDAASTQPQAPEAFIDGGVVWEIAPGRSGPADAGPGYGLAPAQASLGWFTAGLVARDADARH